MAPQDLQRIIQSARARAKTKADKPRELPDISNIKTLAAYIDHTFLKPDGTQEQIKKLCNEAAEFNFKAVCVNSSFIPLAVSLLKGSEVMPITVVGFPLGACLTDAKTHEAQRSIDKGAKEIDTVINIGRLKSGDYEYVLEDIARVAQICAPLPVKVIIETSLLSEDEKIIASILAKEAGADFVKTSTGFAGGGAAAKDISLIRAVVGSGTKIKASGGIKTFKDAMTMIEAGADRIGSSASVEILKGSGLKG